MRESATLHACPARPGKDRTMQNQLERMGMAFAVCLGLVPQLVSCELARPDRGEALESEAFERLLAADREQAARLGELLDARPPTLEELLSGLPAEPYQRESRELGFGAQRVTLDLRSGLTHTRLAVLVVPGLAGRELARIRVDQAPHRPAEWERIEPDLEWAWEGSTALAIERRLDEHSGRPSLRVEHAEPALEAALQRVLQDELGPAPAPELPSELADAHRTMTDALAELPVGTTCGFIGSPTPGFLATELLVAAGRFDLLRSILRGPNPEARVFAAHALSEHGTLDAADAAVIAKLAALGLKLQSCQGCVYGVSDWNGAIDVLAGRD